MTDMAPTKKTPATTKNKASNRRLLIVTFDDSRGVALVRGQRAGDLVKTLDNNRARWSESGHGWVVDKGMATNVIAYAEYAGLIVVVNKRPGGAA